MSEHEIYKQCLLNGIDLNYKKLSLCHLRNYNINRGYQVHLDTGKPFSHIYDDIDVAIDKFILLKNDK